MTALRGRIDEARPSQSGLTLGVKINGKWYSTKSWELQQMVGETIEAQTSASDYKGKTMMWINDYRAAESQTADEAFQAAHTATNPAAAIQPSMASKTPVPRSSSVDRDASIVAQALTKSCTAPGDEVKVVWKRYRQFYDTYIAWSTGAKVMEPTEPEDEFGDEIPF